MIEIGKKYVLNGTDNIFEITGEEGEYWTIKITTKQSVELDVLMTKIDLLESVNDNYLIES